MRVGFGLSLTNVLRSSVSAYAISGFEPALVFDFTAEYYRTGGAVTTFGSAVTFARASNATYVDSAGVLQTAASGVPRLNHHVWNGSAWVNKGLLVESEARTNLISRSNDFSFSAPWSTDPTGATVVKDQIGPDGISNSATTFSDTGTNAVARTVIVSVANDSAVYSASIYIKKTTAATTFPGFGIIFTGGTAVFGQVTVNTNNGTLTDRSGFGPLTKNIEDAGDYWRVSVSLANNSSGNTSLIFSINAAVNSDASGTWVNATTGSCVIYGADMEPGSTSSSYKPTAGATATRAAETLTVPAANLPWNPLAVSIQMKGEMTYADTGAGNEVEFLRWRIDDNNRIFTWLNTGAARTGAVEFRQQAVGVVDLVASSFTTYSPGINVPFNIASRHGSTFINGAVDGVALTADLTPVALPNLSATNLNLAYDFMGTISEFRMWAADLGNTGIAEASA